MAVAEAVITMTNADTTNGKIDKPLLYGNTFNQLLIKYQATGKAIPAEMRVSHR